MSHFSGVELPWLVQDIYIPSQANIFSQVNAQNLVARIFANVFIWGFLGYGLFFIVAYNDYTVGFELSVLTAGMLSILKPPLGCKHKLTSDI